MKHLKNLFILIFGIFILSPGVKAECVNLLPDGEMKWVINSNGYYISLDGNSLFLYSVLNVDTTYTLFATKDGSLVSSIIPDSVYQFAITNGKDVSPTDLFIRPNVSLYPDLSHFTFTPANNSFNIRFNKPNESDLLEMSTWQFWIVEGSDVCLNDQEIEEPDPPIDSDEPTIDETDQGKILSNFYSIYLDRLKFISEFAINNSLFMAFIVVILLFIILELFLRLYHGGGYK